MKLRHLMLAFLVASPLAGAAPADLPERLARLSYVEGEIAFQEAGEPARSTLPERPLLPHDRLATKSDARAEIALGTAALRLDENTAVRFEALDTNSVRLKLDAGIANVTLRELRDGETFEIVTPNTTMTLVTPGEYRLEAPSDDTSLITVHGGVAQAETAGGPVRIADGQRVRFVGREALASLETARPADAFDDWVLQREVQFAEAEPSENMAQPELDRYGEWQDDPTYGRVWMPASVYVGWDPFGYGSWQRVGFGWSWVDPNPWSQYTFYGGRWAYMHHQNRWCWTPPRPRVPRLVHETHPFGRPRDGKGTIVPVDRDPPRTIGRVPLSTPDGAVPRMTPRVTPTRPTGTTTYSVPRNSSPPPPAAAPVTPQTGSGTMRPAGSAGSSNNSSSSTMSARPTRESGSTRVP
jgi:FecR protein